MSLFFSLCLSQSLYFSVTVSISLSLPFSLPPALPVLFLLCPPSLFFPFLKGLSLWRSLSLSLTLFYSLSVFGKEKTNKHKHFRQDGVRDKQEPSLGQMGPLPGTKWDPSLGQTGLSLFNSTVKSPFCPVCPWDGWGFVPGTIVPEGPSEKCLCVFCLLVSFAPNCLPLIPSLLCPLVFFLSLSLSLSLFLSLSVSLSLSLSLSLLFFFSLSLSLSLSVSLPLSLSLSLSLSPCLSPSLSLSLSDVLSLNFLHRTCPQFRDLRVAKRRKC